MHYLLFVVLKPHEEVNFIVLKLED